MDKEEARRRSLALGAVPGDVGSRVVAVLFSWLSARLPGTGSAYLAMSDEVDVTPLFDRLPGWRWVLPRVEDDGTLTFRDRDVARETHRYGMTQPMDQGRIVPVHEIDVFLVPGLAFDVTGGRLGRGKGYYDGVLAGRRADSQAIGVTTTDRVIDAVPVSPHDQRVDRLATEDGVILTRPTQ
ncbi:MAG TPA: 5-formyltetrahydrofolate cyclo-ligase [Acidimicrobiia bacterium]|nr:5-formyltetrahydrofolate cyclo-ligase [Acidimicrobiia bacterium]